MAEDKLAKNLMDRWGLLKSRRYEHEGTWQEIVDLMSPFRGDINTKRSAGQKRVSGVFDSTAMNARDTFVNFLKGALFPSSDSQWFSILPPYGWDDDLEVRGLLDDTRNRVLRALAVSNFYVQSSSALADFSTIGNSVMSVEEDDDFETNSQFGGLSYETVPTTDSWWMCGRGGKVTFYVREVEMPAVDAAEFFGLKDMGVDGREILDKDPMGMVKYLQFVYPNKLYKPGKKGLVPATEKAISSDWVSIGKKPEVVRRSGFDFNPYIVSRWQVVDGEWYGRGRGHLVRPDAKGLNELQRQFLMAAPRDMNPPLILNEDSHLQLNSGPNGISIMKEGTQDPRYLQANSRYDLVLGLARSDREQIERGFMTEALRDPDTQPRSAEESRQRMARSLQRLSAPSETVAVELLNPILDATIRFMQKAKQLPELDEAMAKIGEGFLSYQHVSPFFRSQRESSAIGMYAFMERRLAIFQATQDPRYLDDIDPDALSKIDRQLSSVPSEIFFKPEEVRARREKRAEANAMERTAEMQSKTQGQVPIDRAGPSI